MEARPRIRKFFFEKIRHEIDDDADIFEMGLVDSLFAMQLVTFVEADFYITVEHEDLDIRNFCSVNALAKFVERKLGMDFQADFRRGNLAD